MTDSFHVTDLLLNHLRFLLFSWGIERILQHNMSGWEISIEIVKKLMFQVNIYRVQTNPKLNEGFLIRVLLKKQRSDYKDINKI